MLYAVDTMRKLLVCLLLSAAASLAQTADIAYFRAVMLPSNETPPTDVAGTPTGAGAWWPPVT